MADMFSPEKRSAIMSRIRSKGNLTTELRFITLLRGHKISGWRRGSTLVGKPDFVFKASRVVVFIDGDFWHGNPKSKRIPKSNSDYWPKKIARNRARDRKVTKLLRSDGWTVLRLWESNLKDDRCVAKVKKAIAGRRSPIRSVIGPADRHAAGKSTAATVGRKLRERPHFPRPSDG